MSGPEFDIAAWLYTHPVHRAVVTKRRFQFDAVQPGWHEEALVKLSDVRSLPSPHPQEEKPWR